MSTAPRDDVLILGGGVIGLSCALALLRAGRGVTIVEQNTIGSGSSHGNCGTITPSHLPLNAPGTIEKALKWLLQADAPLRIAPTLDLTRLAWLLRFAGQCTPERYAATARTKLALLQASRARLSTLINDEGLDCEFVDSGTMYVWHSAAGFDAAEAEYRMLRRLGVAIERFDGASARAQEPALNDRIVGGHWHPDDARLRPDRYVAELRRRVVELGGIIVEHAEVTGFRGDGQRLTGVETTRGDYTAAHFVYALGAWSPRLGRALGLRLPIQPGKGYSITYSRPAQPPTIPLVLKERSVCVTSWASGYRLGSTMEFAGYDTTLNRTRLDALTRGAAEYLREPLGPAVEEEWYGWRPMTWDDLPIIGPAPGLQNLTLATGHGMLGVSLSAITGALVAAEVTGNEAPLDPAPYLPRRFY